MAQLHWDFPYPSQRMPVFARQVVATSQPLAVEAGIDALRRGGNALDAALATAITLTVVQPTSNGIGSDAFAIVWDGARLHGLNASGKSPAAWTPERFRGRKEMPTVGWDAVTVPGAVSAWSKLSERFGNLAFEDLFDAAIHYARDGYHVSPVAASIWKNAQEHYKDFAEFQRVFCPAGRAPRPGELIRLPDHAKTLERIAETKGEAFYRGDLAERIAQAAASEGGAMTLDDLAHHHTEWVDPIAQDFAGVRLHEIPPNGQGLAALIALGILRHTPLADYPVDSPDSVHMQIEAMKLAFADAYRNIADDRHMTVRPEQLLDEDYLAERARLIDPKRAGKPRHGLPVDSGTVYLTAADANGMMVSFIQSNFWSFGSGVVVPGTGIALQNRGHGFSLEPGHPNEVGGRKRPFHTIIPGFVTCNGDALMSFGVMGGSFQAQGHVQMMVRIFLHGQNPQAASDARRWCVEKDFRVTLEEGFDAQVMEELRRRGHDVANERFPHFGGAQLIHRLEDGGYCGASDHRKDGYAAGY